MACRSATASLPKPQRLHNPVIAQAAVRTVLEALTATSPDMVSTVVLKGHVETVDRATWQNIQPLLISTRTTREDSTSSRSPKRASTRLPSITEHLPHPAK